jgi:flagellar motor switch protein FliN/FliY
MTEETPKPDPTDAEQADDAAVDAKTSTEGDAEEAMESVEQAAAKVQSAVEDGPVVLPEFGEEGEASASENGVGMGLLDDVSLNVKIELGRTLMYVEDVLRLNADSVIELDKAAGDHVDIFVNDRLVARGEVLVLNDNFCVRVSEILQPRATRQE